MFQSEVFVVKLATVDGFASGAVVLSEVATLAHEVGDDTVEGGALVAEALLADAQRPEVLSRTRNDITPQLRTEYSTSWY